MASNNKFSITIIFLLLCFVISSILMVVANKQFSNSIQEIGEEVPQNILISQESYISRNDALLKSVALKITDMEEHDIHTITMEDIKKIAEEFGEILDIENVKINAIINGVLYTSEERESEGNYKETEWYKKVMQAEEGEIIYTDAYSFNGTDESVITAALRIKDSENILTVDLFPKRITTWPDIDNFPNGTCYYICDQTGKIIHQDSSNQDADMTQEYIEDVYAKLDIEKDGNANTGVWEGTGKKAGIYTEETYNGWKIIVIIPFEHMLANTRNILLVYYTTTVIFSILTIYLTISERRASRGKALYNRITKALGDSYYAIYLIDFEKAQYTILKGAEYIEGAIPRVGNYEDFLNCFESIIEKDAYKEFRKAFSIENIRRLVKNNVSTFGGDFRRAFSSGYKWVNVQLLYSEENVKKKKPEIIFAFQDIDQKKEKELEEKEVLRESVETMQLATQSKNRFFANMSHDMRTPLNAIINLSNMCKDQIDNKEKLMDYLTKINISSTQLLELINNILEVSKIEENTPLVNKVEVNFTEELKRTLSVFEEEAKVQHKKIKINYNIKHDYVMCDWGKIRQIINNIVSNAFKYTRTNGKVFIDVNEIEGKFVSKYEIKVIDNGIGMSKEFLEKIYTPFERETRFHSEEMSGTGLGMSIVQNNVQKLNGQIEVKSEPGEGSEVKVVLPLEIIEGIQVKEKEIEEDFEDLKGKRILLAEDNELNMEIATEILEMQGVKITPAIDGKQVVDIFANSQEGYFDAILMDIQMPIMNGYEATELIRSLPRKDAKTITILAVTANTFAEDIIEAEKAGMNDHIAKPINFAELQKALTKNSKKG